MPWNSMVMHADTTETENFVRIFDKFFYCLNGRNMQEHFKRRKPNLRPYYSSEDDRLKVELQNI